MVGQVEWINKRIRQAAVGDPLYKVPLFEDPTEGILKAAIEACEWNLQSRRTVHTVKDLALLHRKTRELLDLLKAEFPEKSGQVGDLI